MESQVLPGADEELAGELEKALARRGISFLTGTICRDVQVSETGIKAVAVRSIGDSDGGTAIEAEKMLVAVGSAPNSEGLGLDAIGIAVEKGFVRVGPGFRTACETVWAVGDLIGPPLLAHAASAEAVAAVEAMAGRGDGTVNYQAIPACIYSQPEAASIGWTEKRARAERSGVGVAKVPFAANGKAIAVGQTDGFIKMVFDTDTHAILGCHMVGYGVTELINLFSLALSANLRVEDVAHAIYAHPTRSEIVGEAAWAALGRK
jgi:dihydrolipoamide dehydrogenase